MFKSTPISKLCQCKKYRSKIKVTIRDLYDAVLYLDSLGIGRVIIVVNLFMQGVPRKYNVLCQQCWPRLNVAECGVFPRIYTLFNKQMTSKTM